VGGGGGGKGGRKEEERKRKKEKERRRGGEWGVSRSPLESIIKSVTVTFLWEK